MAASVRQNWVFDPAPGNGGQNYMQASPGSATNAGSALWMAGTVSNFAGTVLDLNFSTGTASPVNGTGDDANGLYTAQLDNINSSGSQNCGHFYKLNCSSLGTAQKSYLQLSAFDDYDGLLELEITGASTTTAPGHNGQLQTSPSGAGSISSGNVPTGSVPGLLVACCINVSGNDSPYYPTNVSGTLGGYVWLWNLGSANATWSYQYFASPGANVSATFTPAGSADNYITLAAFFPDAAGGGSTFPPVPGSPYTLPGFQQHNALMVN